MFILDYVIYRIVAVILEMFWDKIVLGSRLYNTRGYVQRSWISAWHKNHMLCKETPQDHTFCTHHIKFQITLSFFLFKRLTSQIALSIYWLWKPRLNSLIYHIRACNLKSRWFFPFNCDSTVACEVKYIMMLCCNCTFCKM